jgi:hypothetical protein
MGTHQLFIMLQPDLSFQALHFLLAPLRPSELKLRKQQPEGCRTVKCCPSSLALLTPRMINRFCSLKNIVPVKSHRFELLIRV